MLDPGTPASQSRVAQLLWPDRLPVITAEISSPVRHAGNRRGDHALRAVQGAGRTTLSMPRETYQARHRTGHVGGEAARRGRPPPPPPPGPGRGRAGWGGPPPPPWASGQPRPPRGANGP